MCGIRCSDGNVSVECMHAGARAREYPERAKGVFALQIRIVMFEIIGSRVQGNFVQSHRICLLKLILLWNHTE